MFGGGGQDVILDSNLQIPAGNCDHFVSTGFTGECIESDTNYLLYSVGLGNGSNLWSDFFELNIPCDSELACEESVKTFLEEGTLFYWTDVNGDVQDPVPWDVNVQIVFKYRDFYYAANNKQAFEI